MKEEHSREFLERRELQKQDEKIVEKRHELKMKELEFQRESSEKEFENRLSLHKLKRADRYRELGIRTPDNKY